MYCTPILLLASSSKYEIISKINWRKVKLYSFRTAKSLCIMSLINYILASIPILFPVYSSVSLLTQLENSKTAYTDTTMPSISSQLLAYVSMGIFGFISTDRLIPSIKVMRCVELYWHRAYSVHDWEKYPRRQDVWHSPQSNERYTANLILPNWVHLILFFVQHPKFMRIILSLGIHASKGNLR